jgi:hypothetical protein
MGVTIINSGLRQEKGITYSEITDSSADWINVTDGAYFYDIATDLPYYKSSSGLILSLFSEANTLYTSNGTLTGDRTVDLDDFTLTFDGNDIGTTATKFNGRTAFTSNRTNPLQNIIEVQDNLNNRIFEVRQGSNVLINAQGSTGSSALSIYNGNSTKIIDFSDSGRVNFSNLPTNAAGLSSGDLWDDGGIVRIGNTVLPDDDSLYTTDSTIGSNRVATLTDNLTFQGGNIFTTINSSSTDESDIESYPLTLRNTELRANNLVGMLFQDNSTDDQARIYTKFGTKNSINFDVKDGTFQNLLKLEGGNVNMSNLPTTSTGLGAGDLWSDNGDVRIGTSTPTPVSSIYTADGALTGNRAVDLDGNNLEISDSVNASTASLTLSSGQGFIFNRNTGGASAVFQDNGVNHTQFGSALSYINSSDIHLGSLTGNNGFKIEGSRIRYFTTQAVGGVIHQIHDNLFNVFLQGFSNPSNSYFTVGGLTRIGSENISLQGSTLIKGNGISTGSALSIYNNDTTPNKLWDFLDNGTLNKGDTLLNIGNSNSITGGTTSYALGWNNNITGGTFGKLAIGDSNSINGNNVYTIGRYNVISASNIFQFGNFLQSGARGAFIIGHGVYTDSAQKLVNNTADSLALGWNTTTPQHLFKSTGSQLGGKTELSSTEDGLLMNRLTTSQRDAISTPDTHLLIFNTDNERIERYDGTAWIGETGNNIYSVDGTLTEDRTVDFDGNKLTFDFDQATTTEQEPINFEFGGGFGGYYSRWDDNGGLTIKSASTYALRVVSKVDANASMFHVGKEGGGFMSTNGSRVWTISGESTDTTKNEFNDNRISQYFSGTEFHRIQVGGSGTGVHFFQSGISGSLGRFIVGGSTQVSSEDISLQGSTLIKGNGTSTGSALSIYNGASTPSKIWDFLDNGDLTGLKSKVKLIAQNSTSNSDSDYILRLRASNDASDRFFVGNGGEVRMGGATNNGTGDKSTHLMWGGDVVTMAGSGHYAILMGQLVSANYSGNDAIGMGRTITLNNQRQIALGQGITFTGEGTFGMGRTLTSTAGDNNIMGTAISSTGRYSNLIGKYLQSSATGASVIGNGNTSTGAKLVNNTANSLALGWNTTTPQHLLSSTGSQLGGKTELTSTTDGFLMNRLTTAQRDAISTPDTHLLIFNTDNDRIERYDGTAWVGEIAGYGVLGIANTLGTYTYYSNYTDAMSAAVAGDTVEQFGNITVTSNVTITIKDGVSINMNGYTYTTDGSTVNAFNHDDTLYEETRFQNGTVKHINTGGVGNALTIGGESHMDCTGLIVISDGAYCLNFNTDGAQRGRLIGGSYIHTGGSGWNHIIEGNVYGAYFNTGDGAVRITGGSLDNCRIDGSVFIASGIISNSRVIGGSYSHAINNEGTVFNTYASSALFMGINNTNGIVENSKGISNATYGIYSTAGTINNSIGESTASYGIYLSNVNAYANGCIAESSAAAAIRLNGGKLYNCKAICTLNNPSGDGILITSNNGFEIIDCYATVVNSSAFAVDGTQSGVISGLKGKGMTALIGSTTNTLTNTIDTFGNGLIG